MKNRIDSIHADGIARDLRWPPVAVERHMGKARRYFPYHNHNYYEISFTFQGEHFLKIGNQQVAYGTGEICVIAPDTMHLIHPAVFESEMSEADEVWVIGLAPDFLQKPLIGRHSAIVVLMGEMQEHLRNNLQLLFEELAEPETNWELVQPLLTVTLEMIRKPIARAEAQHLICDRSDLYLCDILEYIRIHCCEDVSVPDLTGQFNISRSSLMRMFRNGLDLSPIDYRIDWQISVACRLLLEGGLSIQQVAQATGFQDVYYFSTMFRRRMGISPGQFQKSVELDLHRDCQYKNQHEKEQAQS